MILKVLVLISLCFLFNGCTATQESGIKETKDQLSSVLQKSSYATGIQTAKDLRQQDISIDSDAFLLGFNDELANRKAQLSSAEIAKAQEWQAIDHNQRQVTQAAANLAAGKAFLGANKNKDGVNELPSGLQYKVFTAGKEGATKPVITDTVMANYRVYRQDGSELLSTEKQGKPAELPVKKLIKGWQEAVLLMSEGAKWQLFIPPNLAYGENGTPDGKISPNETLVFDMELVDINPPKALNAAKAEQEAASTQPKPSSSWK